MAVYWSWQLLLRLGKKQSKQRKQENHVKKSLRVICNQINQWTNTHPLADVTILCTTSPNAPCYLNLALLAYYIYSFQLTTHVADKTWIESSINLLLYINVHGHFGKWNYAYIAIYMCVCLKNNPKFWLINKDIPTDLILYSIDLNWGGGRFSSKSFFYI